MLCGDILGYFWLNAPRKGSFYVSQEREMPFPFYCIAFREGFLCTHDHLIILASSQ